MKNLMQLYLQTNGRNLDEDIKCNLMKNIPLVHCFHGQIASVQMLSVCFHSLSFLFFLFVFMFINTLSTLPSESFRIQSPLFFSYKNASVLAYKGGN